MFSEVYPGKSENGKRKHFETENKVKTKKVFSQMNRSLTSQ